MAIGTEVKTHDIEESMYSKILGMFQPATSSFLGNPKEDVIEGPKDRAMVGFDTMFTVDWLVEDFGFTEEEARLFVDKVHEKDKEVDI